MKHLKTWLIPFLSGLGAAWLVFAANPAGATYPFTVKWQDSTVTVKVDTTLSGDLTSASTSEIQTGADVWDAVSGATITITQTSANLNPNPSSLNSVPVDNVYFTSANLSGAGHTDILTNGVIITKALMRLDSSPSTNYPDPFTWDLSGPTDVPAGKLGLRAVVSHEMGHALGAVHVSPTTGQCGDGPEDEPNFEIFANTMCEYFWFGWDDYHTLESYEINDFAATY